MKAYKIKLPRKRKKAYIKANGHLAYMSCQVAGEVMYEEEPLKKWTRFPEFIIVRNKIKVLFNW